jgi:hypothetical protein
MIGVPHEGQQIPNWEARDSRLSPSFDTPAPAMGKIGGEAARPIAGRLHLTRNDFTVSGVHICNFAN